MEWTDTYLYLTIVKGLRDIILVVSLTAEVHFNFTHCHVNGNSTQTLTLYVQL
jgi:hypothetical protein